ncbi:LOW QUALITY PROTEIN: hypothetical protein AQUCO_00901034v1 [Aquilegia coerulea]|uniref:Protein FAR1-RELATED SEQUENCE n=1 Tax=Aquilegia coerulea TaxID=218851 RepID=A0A2G5EGH5_AQUCA|nr:LOW QUALITY PROTEIN: hypothetical protein AQUCO_00901034v1 [Aquilegia coerulea]
MYTTQRSESINFYFDKYLKKGLPLYEFMKQYERAVLDRREEENKADFDTYYRRPILRVHMEIEKEGAKLYTREIFYEFQEQVFQGLSYRHKKIDENDIKKVYNKEGCEQVARTVEFEPATQSAKCSCLLFEFVGYLCRHVLKIFMVEDVQNIPEKYILKRWTKDVKSGSVMANESENNLVKSGDSVTSRYCRICQEGVNIASKASPYAAVFDVVMEGFARTLRDVEIALKSLSLDSNLVQSENVENDRNGETSVAHVQLNTQKPLLDPPIKKHKGRDPGRNYHGLKKVGKKRRMLARKHQGAEGRNKLLLQKNQLFKKTQTINSGHFKAV